MGIFIPKITKYKKHLCRHIVKANASTRTNLSPQEQILEINNLIDDFHKGNCSYFDVKNKYNRIQQLKNPRHDILLKL